MVRIPLTGGAYKARSVIASAQRQVNLYAEPMPQAQGEPAPAALYPTAGLRLLTMFPQGPIRGLRLATNGTLYVVAGSGVYSVTSSFAAVLLGSITPGITTPVKMTDNSLTLVIVDGTASGWQVTLASNVFSQISDPTGSFRGGDFVDYLDTFLLFNVPSTPQFQSSQSLAVTFDPLYFANKSSAPDLLVGLIVAKREIWLIGQRTTEVWYDTGAPDFPFGSMQGVFIDHGCAAKYSIAGLDNAVYWLSQDRAGQGIVMQGAGYATKRISTYAIESELVSYQTISDAIGFCYQYNGHSFYHLTFPAADKTWLYDTTTEEWSELAWLDGNGIEHRHRANCATSAYGQVIAGDWQSGNLYALDPGTYTDAGAPIKRLRCFPHLLNDGKRVFYRQFLADMDAGTGQTL